MMRGLAEYVMTGRRQAMIAVMLLGLIPLVNLLNPVVVGLIALRKGLQEAGIVFAWAVLPLGAWAVAGDVVPLIMLLESLGSPCCSGKQSPGNSRCWLQSQSGSALRCIFVFSQRLSMR